MMKKVILTAILSFVVLTMTAQNKTSLGVKANVNMSDFIISDMPVWTSDFGVGAGVGGFAKFDFGEYFAIQPEVLLYMQNSEFEIAGVSNKFHSLGMDVPVYAVGQLVTGDGDRAYIGIGPFGRVNFKAKNTTLDTDYYKDDNSLLQRFDVGCSALVGYEFAFGMQINASYKYGFFNQLNAPAGDSFMRNQSIDLGIGYHF